MNGRYTRRSRILQKRALLMGLLATVGLLGFALKADLAIAAPSKPKLVVLDIELTGDLGGPQFTVEHAARLKTESAILRRELENSGLYQVLDNTAALPLINRLKSQQAYWHDCNGCNLEVGRQLGADQVLVTWVDRVSNLTTCRNAIEPSQPGPTPAPRTVRHPTSIRRDPAGAHARNVLAAVVTWSRVAHASAFSRAISTIPD
jgi:Protein of unknown function (DUF2380)